jgi:hypothetical protein
VLYLGGAETVLGLTDRPRPFPEQQSAYMPASAVLPGFREAEAG